jgi:hypothetical protein
MSWTRGRRELAFSGRLPLEQGAAFEQAIWSIAKTQRAIDKQADAILDWQQSVADALVTLARQYGGDDGGVRRRSPTTLIVHISDEGPPLLEGAGPLSTETAERLVCDARRLAIKPSGRDLVHSRVGRCASYAQQRALHKRSSHCQYPGCSAARELEAHHVIQVERGGRTELDNLILLGLVRETEGVAARILLGFGADAETILRAVVRMLSDPAPALGANPNPPAGSHRGGQATSGRRRLTQAVGDATRGPARLTRGVRNVLLAQGEARALRHTQVGSEHILLGLLCEEHGLAARLLASLGITLAEVRGQVIHIAGEGKEVTTGHLPFTPQVKDALETAKPEAQSLHHDYAFEVGGHPEQHRSPTARITTGGILCRPARRFGYRPRAGSVS